MYRLQKCQRFFCVLLAAEIHKRRRYCESHTHLTSTSTLLESIRCTSSKSVSLSVNTNQQKTNSDVTDDNSSNISDNDAKENNYDGKKDPAVEEVIDILSKIDLNAAAPLLSPMDATFIPSKSTVSTTATADQLTSTTSKCESDDVDTDNNSIKNQNNSVTDENDAADANANVEGSVDFSTGQTNFNLESNMHFSSSEYTPHEVRTLLLSFLPPFAHHASGMEVNEVLNLLPPSLRKQLSRYSGGIIKFVQDYYPNDVIVQDNCRLHRCVNVKESYVIPSHIALNNVNSYTSSHESKSNVKESNNMCGEDKESKNKNNALTEEKEGVNSTNKSSISSSNKSCTRVDHKILTKPPPPPSIGGSLHSTHATPTLALTGSKNEEQGGSNNSSSVANEAVNKEELSEFAKQYTLGARTNLRGQKMIIDTLVEFIPTFYVNTDAVTALLPSWIQELYAETNFNFFIRRFRSYFDTRVQFGVSEVRLRPDFDHPRRGHGDVVHAANLNMGDAIKHLGNLRRPAANTEASLISIIAPRMPREFTSLPEVLQDISDIVARHPAFDPRLGVTGLLEKYPEYFQIVDGKLRARPYKSAPNSVADLDRSSSPFPEVFAKLMNAIEAAAEGKNYSEEREKMMAMVPTGKLYALLSPEERTSVKTQCRSFPRFLRMHGKEIVVTVDNMRVYKFAPEHEVCTDTLLDQRLRMNAISPDDPLLKIPIEMDDSTNADWAVKALYDALPLMQCVELHEVLSLVPPAVRDALPNDLNQVRALLDTYPDYFTTWPYVDNPSIVVVQRAKVEIPTFQPAEIIRLVLPLIPQGGTEIELLFRRVPLPLQRYLYKYGMKTILKSLPEYFAVSGERVIRVR